MLRRLNRRGLVQFLIVALFTIPVFLLTLPTDLKDKNSIYNKFNLLEWIKIEFPKLELASIDARIRMGRQAPVSPQIVFLAIDQASTSSYLTSAFSPEEIAASRPLTLMTTSFPYPRELYARVCDRLFGAGARVVALDMIFPGPSENPANDAAWRSAIDRYHDKLVVGMNFNFDPLNGGAPSFNPPSATLVPSQDPGDERLGYVNFLSDPDGVIRDAQYRANIDSLNGNRDAANSPMYYSLAARAVQKSGHPERVPDDLNPRTMRYAGPPLLTFQNHSLYEIFSPRAWGQNYQNGSFFRDKIVVVGPQGDFVKDKSDTPYGAMDGAEIHLNAINALLQNQFLQRSSLALMLFSIVLAGALALTLALVLPAIGWRFITSLALLAGYVVMLFLVFNFLGWLLPAGTPVTVFCGSMATGIVYDFVLTQIEKLRLRTTFERYNSKNVVKYLLEHSDSYKEMLAGTRRPVTVLFSDVRGFTTIAEETPDSHELVAKLNEYLTAMVGCVFRYDGSLDSFMGDGIMAVWGNTPYEFGPEGDAVRAVRAALAMVEALKTLNAKWTAEGRSPWRIGIGLNHGQVIVGDIGSLEHKEFATIGDAVNLGSRLEGLTKEYRQDIILGESVEELVRGEFHLRSVNIVQVKGKKRAVKAFTVLGEKTEPLSPEMTRFLALYEEAIVLFRRREFGKAKELFEQALEIVPGDFLAADYLAGCVEFLKNPPDAAWSGVRVMTTK